MAHADFSPVTPAMLSKLTKRGGQTRISLQTALGVSGPTIARAAAELTGHRHSGRQHRRGERQRPSGRDHRSQRDGIVQHRHLHPGRPQFGQIARCARKRRRVHRARHHAGDPLSGGGRHDRRQRAPARIDRGGGVSQFSPRSAFPFSGRPTTSTARSRRRRPSRPGITSRSPATWSCSPVCRPRSRTTRSRW